MNRIDQRFAELRSRGQKALVCFLTSGDPDFKTTEKLVKAIADAGADVVELGVPFSDPLADGPSIQSSSFRALQAGASVKRVLENVASIRKNCDVPIVLMSYFNPVYRYGLKEFARDAADAGADGVILTDLPPEEAGEWKSAADSCKIATIFLLAPTSTKDRTATGAKMASGFIYCVSRTGVTGARTRGTAGDHRNGLHNQGGIGPSRGGRLWNIDPAARAAGHRVCRRRGSRKRAGQRSYRSCGDRGSGGESRGVCKDS